MLRALFCRYLLFFENKTKEGIKRVCHSTILHYFRPLKKTAGTSGPWSVAMRPGMPFVAAVQGIQMRVQDVLVVLPFGTRGEKVVEGWMWWRFEARRGKDTFPRESFQPWS